MVLQSSYTYILSLQRQVLWVHFASDRHISVTQNAMNIDEPSTISTPHVHKKDPRMLRMLLNQTIENVHQKAIHLVQGFKHHPIRKTRLV